MPTLPASFVIPTLTEQPEWWSLPCQECGEPLVTLVEGPRLHLQPVYAQLGFAGASTTITLRQGALERLERALATLPETLGFLVYDGFRPLIVQQALWDWQWAEVTRDYPHFTQAEIYEKVRHFVAEPNADPTKPTPHRTGGAVDLTLFELATGAELAMGTAFDEACDATVTDWFERYPQEPLTHNRRLLYHAMTQAGFANYPNEWWHFEYGTRRWAGHQSQQSYQGMNLAVYGSAE
ncbi:M15 family metallopeptidase [Armatimonas rosea]|uniref:D-alanyl-D-alanine dipeptidase n=1 Tax=Armatimonas rosea TaxID=685828 RepID=A0A7W9SLW2_ARMRO|nr:D-alanyl-D-alanine dipeptidase [Armatimonas rosea]